MSTHKSIDRICCAVLAFTLVFTVLFMNGEWLGIIPVAKAMGYEERIFDTSRVHSINIVMDDWDSFIATAENEEYSVCSVVIDGEAYKNVALRAKGNTSLSSVRQYGNNRYSFKIEFDHYDNGSYYGLDKLVLNNLIQDNSMMKDYIVYRMMLAAGAAAPLCSFVYVTVNGEDFGLYLALEAVEDSFMLRNYGSGYGNLYKPDGMNFGGNRGGDKKENKENAGGMGGFGDFGGFGGEIPDFSGNAPTVSGNESQNGNTFPSFSDRVPTDMGDSATEGEDRRSFGGTTASGNESSGLLMLCVSAAVLLFGILFAGLYKRR